MEEVKQKIVSYVRAKGPVLPVEISKAIESDILFAGAILAELVANKQVMISTAKIGGSPVYYVAEQRGKLTMLIDKLGEKPKKAALMLQDKKVLFDKEVEPWTRVALREIKDFAVPLRIKKDGKETIVWKWYMLSNDEVKPLVSKSLGVEKKKVVKEEVKQEVKEIVKEEVKPIQEVREVVQEEIKEEIKQETVKLTEAGSFYEDAVSYLNQKGLKVVKEEMISKKKEFDFHVEYQSDFGIIGFFVKAKDKKKINNSDLDLALHKAKNKSVVFVTSGELTKKAADYVEKELKGSLVFCSI